MADWDKVPRDFLMLVRVIAIAGGLRAIAMAYYGLTAPEPPTPAELAARAARVHELAEEGEAGLAAGYVAKVDLVERAAERCAAVSSAEREHSGDCRLARLWLDRYRTRTDEVLARPESFAEPIRTAAERYARAAERFDSSRS
jgi:hypothetical protein